MSILLQIIKILDFIYKFLLKPVIAFTFQIYYKFQKRQTLPRIRNKLFFKSARELVEEIKSRKVKILKR